MKPFILGCSSLCWLSGTMFCYAQPSQVCQPASLDALTRGVTHPEMIDSACKVLPDEHHKILASAIIGSPHNDGVVLWRVMVLTADNHHIEAQYQDEIDTQDAATDVGAGVLWLDTAPYHLNQYNRAFGVRLATGHAPQYADGGNDHYLTLFSGQFSQGKLVPLIQSLPMSYWRRVHPGQGYENPVTQTENTHGYIQVLPTLTHGLHDLRVVYPTKIKTVDSRTGRSTSQSCRHFQVTLKYDGHGYPLGNWNDIPGQAWYQ